MKHIVNDNKSVSQGISEVVDNYLLLLYAVLNGIEIIVPLLTQEELRKARISLLAASERIGNIGAQND